MPIYDYRCPHCRHRFEQLVKPDETPSCPSCGAADPQRMFPFSASVSTGKTRERSLTAARSKASAQKKEKDRAHQIYLQNHIKDHS